MRKVLALVVVLLVSPALRAQTADPATAAILAKIAALEQEIAVLKAQLPPRAPVVASAPTARPTLAEASAAAGKVQHDWPVSTNAGATAVAGAQPVFTADNPPPELARFVANIKARCLKDFPADATARGYCESSQITPMLETAALNKSGVLNNPAGEVIRLKCLHDWPKDTALFNRCVQAELKVSK